MKILITVSLLLNLLVLCPVCWGIFSDAAWAQDAYGGKSPARSILLSVYLAIGLLSAALLACPRPEWVAVLLVVQVVYKLTTPFTVGTFQNPVVVSNLLIAGFHMVTLVAIWKHLAVSKGV